MYSNTPVAVCDTIKIVLYGVTNRVPTYPQVYETWSMEGRNPCPRL
jgi:hypothetical protein